MMKVVGKALVLSLGVTVCLGPVWGDHPRQERIEDVDLGQTESLHPSLTSSMVWIDSKDLDASPIQKVHRSTGIRSCVAPLVDDRLRVDTTFQQAVPVYAQLQRLSYELVKGCLDSSTSLLEQFQKSGWQIRGFEGLSAARWGHNRDLPGIVAFHAQTGEAVVVFHGSQDPYDWKDNFDTQMAPARGLGFAFDGRVTLGYGHRYLSSKKSLYRLLDTFKAQLPESFRITVVGHSLGGGMGELATADLVSDYGPRAFGSAYDNGTENRIQAYLMSGALVFDGEAAQTVEGRVGRHNVIQDAVACDPVYFLSGKSTAAYLEGSSAYGPTAWGLSLLRWLGLSKVSHPQAAAFLYGKDRHIGYEALQDASWVQARASALQTDQVREKLSEKSWGSRQIETIAGGTLAPIHYGTHQIQQDGSGKLTKAFDPALMDPGTLSHRLQRVEKDKKTAAQPAPVESRSWYGWIKSSLSSVARYISG